MWSQGDQGAIEDDNDDHGQGEAVAVGLRGEEPGDDPHKLADGDRQVGGYVASTSPEHEGYASQRQKLPHRGGRVHEVLAGAGVADHQDSLRQHQRLCGEQAGPFPSGVNREQATDYHRFVLELTLVAAVEADAAGAPLSAQTWERIGRMLDAAAAVLDVAGGAPRQGDGDEGRGLVVDDPELDPWAVVLSVGARLLGPLDWWPAVRPSVAAVLLGGLGRSRTVSDRPAR